MEVSPSKLAACPPAERILQLGDGLRTVTLVARDAANLAIALGAAGEEASELWRSLATHINPSLSGATPAAEGAPCWVLVGDIVVVGSWWVLPLSLPSSAYYCWQCLGRLLGRSPRLNSWFLMHCTAPPTFLPAALAAVQRAVRTDPARTQRCTMSAAKTEYRLSDKDLKVSVWRV